MRVGLQIVWFDWPGGAAGIRARLSDIAGAAEEAGFYSLWTMDHFFQMEAVGAASDDMLEGYSTLAYLAALTENVRLGTLVTGVTYRHPGVLAKTVSTLDVLSGGRAYMGLGAAWYEREARALGLPFPPTAERFERLEETLQIVRQMWSENSGPYEGRHYQLAETINSPQPLSQPHPPILVGGSGEKKTLRLVAQYADACNLNSGLGIDGLRHKFDVLKRHCDDIGRPYEEIERTVLGDATLEQGGKSASDIINLCRDLAAAGVQHAIFNMRNIETIKPLEIFGREIIPAVAEF